MPLPRPEITCVIPTFNDRDHLPRAVRSALSQEGVDVEVLLVDDCSDEPTRRFIEELASGDPRIRTFFLSRNGGQGQARNIGAALANARAVAFLDQDDEHAAGWYQHALGRLAADPSLAAVAGLASIVDLPPRLGLAETDERLRQLSFVFVTNIVFRTSVFRASGGFPTSPLWRTRIAGEDSVYRAGVAAHWKAVQSDRPALIHHAREGGATVYYLDRSEVRDGQVVITRPEQIEVDGRLAAAHREFEARFEATTNELCACAAAARQGANSDSSSRV